MVERPEEPETEAQETLDQASPAAVSIALGRTSKGGKALDDDARTFLREQTDLIRIQKEHLHEQRDLQLAHLRVRRWKDRLSLALQSLGVALGGAIVITLGVMAWQAHEDHGLMVDAFSVPPDLARDGLTGQVVAARFLDKLQAMQSATFSDRPASSYQNDWGSEIKLEIPETGLTFGDLEKLLREKLGRASHITGEVTRTPTGIALTARLGDAPPQTFEGSEAGLDAIAQQAAEAVYRSSQPYRFSQYLDQHGRVAEAVAVIADLAANGPQGERGWAYSYWATIDLNDHADLAGARTHGLQALAEGGGSTVESEIALVGEEVWSGHDQKALAYSTDLAVKSQTRAPEQTQAFVDANRLIATGWLESLIGDERRSAETFLAVEKQPGYPSIQSLSPALAATAFALDHDLESARTAIALKPTVDDTPYLTEDAEDAFSAAPVYWIAAESGDWPAALADARAADAWIDLNKPARPLLGLMQPVWIHPLEALALARRGDVSGAEALIATTPLDCYLCLRTRGQIAAEAKDWPSADRWFEAAVRQAPSLPFAYADWGRSLMARGDAAAAADKAVQAHRTSPHFADPLELWGEALMKTGDLKGAVARFREAGQDAPRWGRNHLLWGEALARLGRAAEARAEWKAAATMHLSPVDRAELARIEGHG